MHCNSRGGGIIKGDAVNHKKKNGMYSVICTATSVCYVVLVRGAWGHASSGVNVLNFNQILLWCRWMQMRSYHVGRWGTCLTKFMLPELNWRDNNGPFRSIECLKLAKFIAIDRVKLVCALVRVHPGHSRDSYRKFLGIRIRPARSRYPNRAVTLIEQSML